MSSRISVKKYTRKPQAVEVVQISKDFSMEELREVGWWISDGTFSGFVFENDGYNTNIRFNDAYGEPIADAHPGDYVVRYNSADIEIFSELVFEDYFEEREVHLADEDPEGLPYCSECKFRHRRGGGHVRLNGGSNG